MKKGLIMYLFKVGIEFVKKFWEITNPITTSATTVFIVLQCNHVITWSWWRVLSPLWIMVLVPIVMVFLFNIVAVIVALLNKKS